MVCVEFSVGCPLLSAFSVVGRGGLLILFWCGAARRGKIWSGLVWPGEVWFIFTTGIETNLAWLGKAGWGRVWRGKVW